MIEQDRLGQKAMTCLRWRWLDGMRVIHTPTTDGATGFFIRLSQDGYVPARNEFPDLDDAATLGCLLALVRKAWSDATIRTNYAEYVDRGGEWSVFVPVVEGRMLTYKSFEGKTEAEALVAALEGAP